MTTIQTTFRNKGYKYPVTLTYHGNKIYIKFAFNRALKDKVKALAGSRWDPAKKVWYCDVSIRNTFQLDYLQGKDVYGDYDKPIIEYIPKKDRGLRNHQRDLVSHAITRRMSIWAAEMGTGKSLASIEAVEWFRDNVCNLTGEDVWYFGPVSGVRAVRRELVKWNHDIPWTFNSYNKLSSIVKNWPAGKPAPRVVIFDESSKIKNPNAQCSQAALHIANAMREEYGKKCLIILMSGTPAPRVPTDWWHQCEVARPGFLIEANVNKLKYRLSIIEQRESLSGGVYPHLVTWKDDPSKCDICGEYLQNHMNKGHDYVKSIDEISYLHKRMEGLVMVVFKKDCMDLPEKQYKILAVKPTPEMMRLSKMIRSNSPNAAIAFSKLRELSDGFQYKTQESGLDVTCDVCNGFGQCEMPVDGESAIDEATSIPDPSIDLGPNIKMVQMECPKCEGTGHIPGFERYVESLGSPKDDLLKDLLDEYSDVGRIIIWAGFQGSIDRITEMCKEDGWAILRVDGRGYHATDKTGQPLSADDLLSAMDLSDPKYKHFNTLYPKVAFVGNPDAGGMALTLTASPVEIFYSNSFNGAARPQAEDRAHRIGMDENRGLLIIDIFCLPSDAVAHKGLKLKKQLQSMTMGELNDAWASAESEVEKYTR